MTNTSWAIVIIVVLVLAGLVWWYYQPAESAPTPATTSSVNAPPANSAPVGATVTHGSNGFSPQEVTIARGGTVTLVDDGDKEIEVASAQHPTHSVYDGTTRDQHCAAGYTGVKPLDQCTKGDTYSFTFDNVGTWGYHNHRDVSHFGKVIVVE